MSLPNNPVDSDHVDFVDWLSQQGAVVRRAKSGNILVVDLRQFPIDDTFAAVRTMADDVRFAKLRELYLANNSIDDRIAQCVPSWPKLKHLELERCQVTSVTLMSLAKHEKLELLNLRGTWLIQTMSPACGNG